MDAAVWRDEGRSRPLEEQRCLRINGESMGGVRGYGAGGECEKGA